MSTSTPDSQQWGTGFNLVEEAGFHLLFSGIRSIGTLGLKSLPIHLKQEEIKNTISSDIEYSSLNGYFTFEDLTNALKDDFLDANRGSTKGQQGWKVCIVHYICVRTVCANVCFECILAKE